MSRQTVIPQLRLTDAARSHSFHVDQPGFTVDWTHQFEPGLPLFMQITRQGQKIFLSGHSGDFHPGGAISCWVPDADATYATLLADGVLPVSPIEEMPWGVRVFVLVAPDHNKLRFGTELPN